MQGDILPPIFGLGPWDGAQVVSPRSPILRFTFLSSVRSDSATELPGTL